jgi:hypothetical protein
MNPNIREIGNVIKQMQVIGAVSNSPTYNQAAADIIKQGIEDKNAARLNYTPQLSRPITTPKKPL